MAVASAAAFHLRKKGRIVSARTNLNKTRSMYRHKTHQKFHTPNRPPTQHEQLTEWLPMRDPVHHRLNLPRPVPLQTRRVQSTPRTTPEQNSDP